MRIDLPSMMYNEPVYEEYAAKFRNQGMVKIAYECAMRIYWRTQLSEAQNHRCCWCGKHMVFIPNRKDSATIEHVIPRSQGGADHPDNYAVACGGCNTARGNMPAEEFMQRREQLAPSKRKQEEAEKQAIVCELREKFGVHRVSTKVSKTKLEDKLAAIKAVQTETKNPFAEGTRSHRYFERYSANGYASYRAA